MLQFIEISIYVKVYHIIYSTIGAGQIVEYRDLGGWKDVGFKNSVKKGR